MGLTEAETEAEAEVVAIDVGVKVGVSNTVAKGVGEADEVNLFLSQTRYAAKATIIKMIIIIVTFRFTEVSPLPGSCLLIGIIRLFCYYNQVLR